MAESNGWGSMYKHSYGLGAKAEPVEVEPVAKSLTDKLLGLVGLEVKKTVNK